MEGFICPFVVPGRIRFHLVVLATWHIRSKKDGCGLPTFRFSADVPRTDRPGSQYRSVHLWMNESENACDKHDHRNAQQGNGEPLYVGSRCLFGG